MTENPPCFGVSFEVKQSLCFPCSKRVACVTALSNGLIQGTLVTLGKTRQNATPVEVAEAAGVEVDTATVCLRVLGGEPADTLVAPPADPAAPPLEPPPPVSAEPKRKKAPPKKAVKSAEGGGEAPAGAEKQKGKGGGEAPPAPEQLAIPGSSPEETAPVQPAKLEAKLEAKVEPKPAKKPPVKAAVKKAAEVVHEKPKAAKAAAAKKEPASEKRPATPKSNGFARERARSAWAAALVPGQRLEAKYKGTPWTLTVGDEGYTLTSAGGVRHEVDTAYAAAVVVAGTVKVKRGKYEVETASYPAPKLFKPAAAAASPLKGKGKVPKNVVGVGGPRKKKLPPKKKR